MRSLSVSEAVASRMSCRAFLDTPVSGQEIRAILDAARQAPSGGNLQPWRVYAVAGEPLNELKSIIAAKLPGQPMGEGSEYNMYPPNLTEPYRSRRFKCGEDLYATIGIARENKAGRLAQFARNFEFFGAPAAMFFAIDRQMGADQWSDVGMFIQTIMLLARERGLHTCPQEAWSLWYRTLGEFLAMPPELMLFCGMSIGYRDETAPINRLKTDRAPLEEFASFRGF
jgi:nitroreductase